MYGWAGRILRVDLSSKRVRKQPLSKGLRDNFIGGRGINAKILLDEVAGGTGAFDPENRLIFGTGPLTGTLAPGTGRFNVTTRSPSGFLGDSNSGGHWAPELKFAGYDHIVIWGRADKPVYLWICDNEVEIRDGEHLWGKDTWETQQIIRNDLGDQEIKTVCIGQAGENLVRFANIRTGPKNSAGRTGTGAVMGSKNLKAIAVRGTEAIRIADPERFMEAADNYRRTIEASGRYIGGLGGGTYSKLWFVHNEGCVLITRHQQSGHWEDSDKLDPRIFHKKYVDRMIGCFSCPKPCTPHFKIDEGAYKGLQSDGPEYEAMASFGGAPIVTDMDQVLKASVDADKYGLDCDSCGRVISYAMELYQHGIVSEKDVGFPLKWGDGEVVLRLIEMITFRKGFGDILAEGEVRAGQRIGNGAEKYVLAIKGLEQHETFRVGRGFALAQATSTRGSDHLRGDPGVEAYGLSPEDAEKRFGHKSIVDPFSYENKGPLVILYQHQCALADMLEICKLFSYWTWIDYSEDILAELFSSATGIQMSGAQLLKAAERVYNVERLFIMREGAKRNDDYQTWRTFDEPLPSGPFKGHKLDREQYELMLNEYYETRGWDVKTGIPARKRLKELGLSSYSVS